MVVSLEGSIIALGKPLPVTLLPLCPCGAVAGKVYPCNTKGHLLYAHSDRHGCLVKNGKVVAPIRQGSGDPNLLRGE